VIFPPNYFFSPFLNEDRYLRDIGTYYKEKYRLLNILHGLAPNIFPKQQYKYSHVLDETLAI
jgi:hypothetical protein